MVDTVNIVLFAAVISAVSSQIGVRIAKENLVLSIGQQKGAFKLDLIDNVQHKLLSAELGVGLSLAKAKNCTGLQNCLQFGDVRLQVYADRNNSFSLLWSTTNMSQVLRDCYSLNTTHTNWFGGPERWVQDWPIEKLVLKDFANIPQELNFSAIVEPYWLSSQGYYIFIDKRTPLFINQNGDRRGDVCFIAKKADPYIGRTRVLLQYTIAKLTNPREAHLHAVKYFLGKPTGHPNIKMIQKPIWSTWARYKRDVSDALSIQFAKEIVSNGYAGGQFELDDDWEECYGALTFNRNKNKFANIESTVRTIKAMGFRFTLWVHPFVNIDCKTYTNIGIENNFFVKNTSGSVRTQWWNSKTDSAQYLDFTNLEVREWFKERLLNLQKKIGIDSFKFDAGEITFAPMVPTMFGDIELSPMNLAVDYVETCAEFGDHVEVRTGYNTQNLLVFVRMIDKDSTWGNNNGLYTLITTLLQMNLNGYTMVLPDMVGGNGYFGAPDAELFIRWLQATTFMPSIQFSYVPWDYKNSKIDVMGLSHTYVSLHDNYTSAILKAMNNSIQHGYLVNGPVWWVDPTNRDAHKIDTEYMLGEDILVAPVITKGAVSRDVYLPSGQWLDPYNRKVYTGRAWLRNYPAPISVLPYFLRKSSYANTLSTIN